MRAAWVEVNLANLRLNVQYFRSAVGPDCEIYAVVKGNGYGHGAVTVSRAALEAGATGFAVAMSSEARELREAGLQTPILIMGESSPDEATEILEIGATPALATPEVARALSSAAATMDRVAEAHLKIDSGMGRQGIRWDEINGLIQVIAGLGNLRISGLFTHFAVAESDAEFTRWQHDNFLAACEKVEAVLGPIPYRHCANTAAAILYPDMRHSMVRLGIGWCGLNPGVPAERWPRLQPTLSLRANVVLTKTVHAGDSVGYGRTWRAERDTRIALLPLGYCDGYPRALSDNADVLVHGIRCPVVGRISMDATLVDVTQAGDVQVGDEAVLIGRQGQEEIRVEEIAERAGTIVQNIVSTLSVRLPRVYVDRPQS